jgi:CubicO group peptidase (beta-lactamase class C family)
MKKTIKRILLGILFVLIAGIVVYYPKLKTVWLTMHFFEEDVIVDHFTGMNKIWQTSQVDKSTNPFIFPQAAPLKWPESFSYEGKTYDSRAFLDSSYTTGFLVLQDDSLRFEQYYLGHSPSTQHISWSMAKSYVSALFGIAMEEGYIKSIEQKVEEYLPELKGSGYEGVRIKDVLQMSSGVRFNEDYGDLSSDINRWGRSFAWGSSQDKFAATLVREREPGTYNHYVSINTHVLGMILVKATGQSLTQYLHDKLWQPLGCEYDAYWLIDDYGMEMALGGLNVCLRDYARIGQLFLHEGNWNGKQIVPSAWMKASVTPDAPHLMPGKNEQSAHQGFGYGYQWWVPEGDEGEFMAMGIYNQYIYINPTTHTVIAKNSANPHFNDKSYVWSRASSHLELFRAIAHGFAEKDALRKLEELTQIGTD